MLRRLVSDRRRRDGEAHVAGRTGWLRAAVLGADDGIVSTASLMLGVAAARSAAGALVTAGVAGLAAGALSMAAGEYVSVSSQRDAERADLERERREHLTDPQAELAELAGIYERRGLTPELAHSVAVALSARGALAAHARDELGLTEVGRARPVQAAASSAASFAVGGLLPVVAVVLTPRADRVPILAAVALVVLAAIGALAALVGGASRYRGAARVLIGGAAAMAVTALVGRLVGGGGL